MGVIGNGSHSTREGEGKSVEELGEKKAGGKPREGCGVYMEAANGWREHTGALPESFQKCSDVWLSFRHVKLSLFPFSKNKYEPPNM